MSFECRKDDLIVDGLTVQHIEKNNVTIDYVVIRDLDIRDVLVNRTSTQ